MNSKKKLGADVSIKGQIAVDYLSRFPKSPTMTIARLLVADHPELFLNLDESSDWKQNEYMLKNFFRSSDPSLRKEINVWNSQTI